MIRSCQARGAQLHRTTTEMVNGGCASIMVMGAALLLVENRTVTHQLQRPRRAGRLTAGMLIVHFRLSIEVTPTRAVLRTRIMGGCGVPRQITTTAIIAGGTAQIVQKTPAAWPTALAWSQSRNGTDT